MTPLLKVFRLPPDKRSLLFNTAILLQVIQIGLIFFPFQAFHAFLIRRAESKNRARSGTHKPGSSRERIVWAVRTAAFHLPPHKTCLVQSLAIQTLCARFGHPAELRLGIAKPEKGKITAHAWVEDRNGRIIGEPADRTYVPFPAAEDRFS